jgi:hypothetical protein
MSCFIAGSLIRDKADDHDDIDGLGSRERKEKQMKMKCKSSQQRYHCTSDTNRLASYSYNQSTANRNQTPPQHLPRFLELQRVSNTRATPPTSDFDRQQKKTGCYANK